MAWSDVERNTVNPIGKRKFTLSVLNTESEKTLALNGLVRGTITRIVFEVPDLDGTGTATLSIIDEDGKELYSSGALAESTDHTLSVSEDVTGDETWKIVTDVAQTADRALVVKAWYE
jgi:hypothetical protein